MTQLTKSVTSFHEFVFFIAHVSSCRRRRKNKQVNSTGCKSSLTYSMILSPGGRKDQAKIEPLPTMNGARGGDRRGISQYQGSDLSSPDKSFPLQPQNAPAVSLNQCLFISKSLMLSKQNHIKENMQCPVYTVKKYKNTAPKY